MSRRGWLKFVACWQDDVCVTLAGHLLALGWALKQIWDTGLLATRELKRQAEVVLLERSHPVKGDSQLLTKADLTGALMEATSAQLGSQRLVVKGDLDHIEGRLHSIEGRLHSIEGHLAPLSSMSSDIGILKVAAGLQLILVIVLGVRSFCK